MDLSELEDYADLQEAGVEVEIRHPITDEVMCTIMVAGPDSRIARIAHRRALLDVAEGRNLRESPLTDQDEERYRVTLLARAIRSWSGVRWGGEEMDCTYENAVRLLERFPFVMTQLDNGAKSRARFLPQPQTTS